MLSLYPLFLVEMDSENICLPLSPDKFLAEEP
ncbi:Uncharacterised protein [Porphyromonas crevioricanis]|uniref:Uncharacterized protein n=1 Tax=Porphyromonas crevioricanis TaxID=393921 RepID=A0A2X4PZP1_9PORP|nr:Uncharacterised protein [Porphyromonas crevioricanis]